MQNHPANRLFGAPGVRPARCGPVLVHGLDGLPMDRGWLGFRAHDWRLCRTQQSNNRPRLIKYDAPYLIIYFI